MSRARDIADLSSVSARLDTVGGSEGALSNRNIIINGKFEVDQRHGFASHTVSSGSDFFADRWGFYTDAGAFAQYGATSQVVSDGPTGFEKSLKWTTTSSGTIPATGEVLLRQVVEGYNISHVDYGSSSAKELTLSFYVKSSIAGNYGFTAQYTDSGGTNRYNLRSYTVNSANTWEFKTISIPANTANALQQKTNGAGLRLNWDLGEGTDYSGTVTGNWQTTYVNGLTGGVKIADNNGATWQITGVQLEVGDTATDFEHRSYGDELARCQRYYFQMGGEGLFERFADGFNNSSTQARCVTHFPVTMRSAPSVSYTDNLLIASSASNGDVTGIVADFNNTHMGHVKYNASAASLTAGQGASIAANNSTNTRLKFEAEL